MRDFIRKIKNKLNNRGSSIIMVVVSIGFIGIVIGALLSAASYAYRLKLQEMNAKDNFYYVEQAMNEIYAGVGTHTVEEMKNAYTYTLENMVRYDTDLGTYKTISDEEASKMFKKQFMINIKNSDYFKDVDNLSDELAGYISNETVKLDDQKLSIVKRDDEIIIKDVTLTRTQEYKKNTANGTYTQTISADIVISEPDFEVKFNNIASDYSAIFDFALIGDMGVEINQDKSTKLSIVGNIYAASDYYNKSYNSTLNDNSDNISEGDLLSKEGSLDNTDNKISGTYEVEGADIDEDSEVTISYKFANVSNKNLKTAIGVDDLSTETGFVNDYAKDDKDKNYPFNGLNDHSKYSGLYISNANVSILADSIIVPGTFAIMDTSDLTVYGKTGSSTIPQIWADDIVLGGYSKKNNAKSTEDQSVYDGSAAMFRANLFVKDDTEINAEGSSLTLNGSYYGYGDSTSRDSREFFDTVDEYYFKLPSYDEDGNIVKDADGNIVYAYNRGHYNSSAIVVNGERATLDLSNASELYVAGRAYIELSKFNTDGIEDTENDTITNTYQYIPSDDEKTNFVKDYKTGESIAYKTSQLMYIVSNFGVPSEVTLGTTGKAFECTTVEIPEKLNGVGEFGTLFPTSIFSGRLPVEIQTIRDRDYVLIDFETAYNYIKAVSTAEGNPSVADSLPAAKVAAQAILDEYDSADAYASAFAVFYSSEAVKGETSLYYPELINITAYSDYDMGGKNEGIAMDVITDDKTGDIIDFNSKVYSSGAISVRMNNKFTMTTADDATVINDLLSDAAFSTYRNNVTDETDVENMVADAYNISNDLEMEYNYMKWNLSHYKANDIEKEYVSDVIKVYGEDSITPINKYMLFDNFSVNKDKIGGKLENYELNDLNGSNVVYRLWASDSDVTVTGAENITGIVISKGDVTFGDDVKTFSGMVISGGKIYIGNNMSSITADAATCREIIRQCIVTDDDSTNYFLNLFKEYAPESAGGEAEDPDPSDPKDDTVDISTIGYSDVVSMQNWMKNVGGAY